MPSGQKILVIAVQCSVLQHVAQQQMRAVAGNGLTENVERLLQIKEEESEKLLPIV